MKQANIAIVLLALVAALGLPSGAQAQTATVKPKLNIAILIFDRVQIIDYTGPYEVLAGGGSRNVWISGSACSPVGAAAPSNATPRFAPRSTGPTTC